LDLGRNFTEEEFEAALKQVGMNRAIGADGIPIEVIKLAGGPNLLRTILALCNGALYHEGDRLTSELTLQRIALRSAVLSFRGYRFSINY
jgi:hypothetical protein